MINLYIIYLRHDNIIEIKKQNLLNPLIIKEGKIGFIHSGEIQLG